MKLSNAVALVGLVFAACGNPQPPSGAGTNTPPQKAPPHSEGNGGTPMGTTPAPMGNPPPGQPSAGMTPPGTTTPPSTTTTPPGGTPTATNGTTTTTPPATGGAESAADAKISGAVRSALAGDKTLAADAKNIQVATANGVTTLSGTVASAAEKTTAESKAKSVAGVTRVDDKLTVKAAN